MSANFPHLGQDSRRVIAGPKRLGDLDFAFHPALGMSGYGALVFDLALGERHRDFLSAVTAYFGFCRADL